MLNSKCTKRLLPLHRLGKRARQIFARRTFKAFTKSHRAKKLMIALYGYNCTPMAIAMKRTMLMPRADVDAIMELSELSIKQAARGELTHDSFSMLCTALGIAKEVERHGEVRGFAQDIAAADSALTSIYSRCMASPPVWQTKACTASELSALQNFISIHRFQMENILRATLVSISSAMEIKEKSKGAVSAMDVASEIQQMRKAYQGYEMQFPRLVAA
ncbi:hypothetical protein [Comamonas aquatica]|uniref:hypothetical protein n=1 Tax=Comamonas aquatica TaxID=225991 RepID=UPI0034D63708